MIRVGVCHLSSFKDTVVVNLCVRPCFGPCMHLAIAEIPAHALHFLAF